jgi:arginase
MAARFSLSPYFIADQVPGLEPLAGPDWNVIRPEPVPGDPQARMVALYRPLASWVTETTAAGDRAVCLLGDCLGSLGVLAGLQQAGVSPNLIWLDAHGDFNTWETTPSGFLGGMPLAMMVGRGDQTMVEGLGLTLQPEAAVILTDARDLDPGEREAVAGSALHHLPDPASLLELPLPEGPLYVHFDTDIVNLDQAPAMRYPAPAGPSVESLRRVFRRLAGSGQIVAVSLSAWDPALDRDGQSRDVCMALLAELTGS